jgi:predicted RNase H-like HicB family nuclease
VKVTAVYRYERQPDGGTAWIVELVEDPRCHTFGRTLRAAQRNIREAAAAWYEVEPSQVEVNDDVRLPPTAGRALGRSWTLRDRERKAHEQARDATAAAVAALRDVGLSERDTGTLLGLSHQRVHQLASRAVSKRPDGDAG